MELISGSPIQKYGYQYSRHNGPRFASHTQIYIHCWCTRVYQGAPTRFAYLELIHQYYIYAHKALDHQKKHEVNISALIALHELHNFQLEVFDSKKIQVNPIKILSY